MTDPKSAGFVARRMNDFRALAAYLGARRALRRVRRGQRATGDSLTPTYTKLGTQAQQDSIGKDLPEFVAASTASTALDAAQALLAERQSQLKAAQDELAAQTQTNERIIAALKQEHAPLAATASRTAKELSAAAGDLSKIDGQIQKLTGRMDGLAWAGDPDATATLESDLSAANAACRQAEANVQSAKATSGGAGPAANEAMEKCCQALQEAQQRMKRLQAMLDVRQTRQQLAQAKTEREAAAGKHRASASTASAARTAADVKKAQLDQAEANWRQVRQQCQAKVDQGQTAVKEVDRSVQAARGPLEAARCTLGKAICQAGIRESSIGGLLSEVEQAQRSLSELSGQQVQIAAQGAAARGGALRAGLMMVLVVAVLVALTLGINALISHGERTNSRAEDQGQQAAQGAGATPVVDPTQAHGLMGGPVQRTPADAKLSGSKPLDVSPAPGLHLTAPANALDRDRQFKVAPMSSESMAAVCRQAARSNEYVVGGFDLDGGMTAKEVFPGDMTLALDLKHFDVPPELRDSLMIAMVDPKGGLIPLPTRLKGDTLSAQVRHNNQYVLVVTLWATMYGIMAYQDSPSLPKGDFTGIYWVLDDCRFRLLYPKNLPHRDPDQADEYKSKMFEVVKKYGLDQQSFKLLMDPPKSDSWNPFAGLTKYKEAYNRLCELKKDRDYQQLMYLMRDKKWLKEVWLPVCVGHAATALDRAYDYLVTERGIRPPGIVMCSYSIDVYVANKILSQTSYGECRNLWTTRPFLILNADKIPDVDEAAFAGPMAKVHKTDLDALQTTAVHELFHACQSAYNFFDMPSYLWFNEATAVTLEKEAEKYYRDKGFVTSWDDTGRTFQAYTRELDYTDGASNSVTQNHGYSGAYFVEALRNRYFAADGKAFMPKLMDDFAGFRGGTVASLYRATSGRQDTFEKDYWLFCLERRKDIVGMAKNTDIAPATPYYCWKLPKSMPLSAAAVELTFKCGGLSADALDGALLVANDSTGDALNTGVDWQPLSGEWSVVPSKEYAVRPLPKTPGDFTVAVQRIEPYVTADPKDGTAELGSTDIFLLLKPPAPAQTELKDGQLTIRIPDTPLMKAPPAPTRGTYVKAYQVTIAAKGDPKTKVQETYDLDKRANGVLTITRPCSDILKALGQQSMADTPLVVTYREVVNFRQKIMGPPSPPAEVDAGGAVLMPMAMVHMEMPHQYRVGGSNKSSGKTFDSEYKFEHEFKSASWAGTTLATKFKAADGLDDTVTIVVDRKADKIAKLTIGRENHRQTKDTNETGRVEFTWQNIPRRHTIDLGPKGPAFYLFFISGKDAQQLSTAAVNEASGTATEYNPDTNKAETVTFSSKLTSVNWAGGFVFVVLGTMSDEQINDLVTKKVITEEEMEKRFAKPMQEFMEKIRGEMEACKAARQKTP